MSENRRQAAYDLRCAAAEAARTRVHPEHLANGDEQRFASARYAMSFTKGLEHDSTTGLVARSEDFKAFRRAIDEGFVDTFTSRVRPAPRKKRKWEAPTAGVVYELQGPDPQAVTMDPAPALGSDELAYEMAEVYELALCRDVDFTQFESGSSSTLLDDAVTRLNALPYDPGADGRPRTLDGSPLTAQTAFRGSSPGCELGPYVSQFMLIGNDQPGRPGVTHGHIQYGALSIDQRVPVAASTDYMTTRDAWREVQDGASTRNNRILFDTDLDPRFIAFPRDLATYVHDDALYEAYLNACLILLSMGAPFDPGFDNLSGGGEFFLNSLDSRFNLDDLETFDRAAGGFALWGGPHILTLVTEVATRALKAVRFQKFNNHCRLRPEALAGRIEFAAEIEAAHPTIAGMFTGLASDIQPTVDAIKAANSSGTALLPMAFQEGSPMHPAYGAGHATVAGACVTILKAFFDTDAVFVNREYLDENDGDTKKTREVFDRYAGARTVRGQSLAADTATGYRATADGSALEPRADSDGFLTVEGELNKLAANISIGRNMGGVHYYSDYYDSLRMGEEIAIRMLEEQALCYTTDPFVMSLPTFDGEVVRIGAR